MLPVDTRICNLAIVLWKLWKCVDVENLVFRRREYFNVIPLNFYKSSHILSTIVPKILYMLKNVNKANNGGDGSGCVCMFQHSRKA